MIGRTLAGWGRILGLGKTRPSAEEDRRLSGRVYCDVPTTCRPTQDAGMDGVQVRVKNVSMGGACFQLPVELPLGELISMRLPGPKEEDSDILACVVRCDTIDETTWEIGCTFASPLSSQELRRFDEPADDSGPSDRRGWERFPCQARAEFQFVRADEADEYHPATIVNISGGGLAIQAASPLHVGELLSVDLYHGEEHVLTALASVVRTYRNESRLVAGCNFIGDLGEEDLARLVG